MLIQFGHNCLIQSIFFEIQFDPACLISRRFNLTMLVYSNLSFPRFSWTVLIQFHADSIPPCLFNPTYVSMIQFYCAPLISCGFSSAMLILSYLPFSNSIWSCSFNLTRIQFSHACLILSIFFEIQICCAHLLSRKFHSAMLVLSYQQFQYSIRPCSFTLMQIQFGCLVLFVFFEIQHDCTQLL